MDKDIKIFGKRIYIRPITVNDTDEVLNWRNSENVVKNFIYRKPISKEEHLNWLKTKVDTGEVVQFVVCDIATGEGLGSVYTQDANSDEKIGESGIFLGNTDKLGKGIGTEAYGLLIQYCFEVLDLDELKARVLASNPASQRLHEKLGYKRIEYLEKGVLIEGKYEDLILYRLTNPRRDN